MTQTTQASAIRARWKIVTGAMCALVAFVAGAQAQGSRKDDIVFGPGGHPVAGATITVCQANATGTPCSPLATIYTDATLTVPTANPFQGDGIGNYHFYAPPGRYTLQITGPSINGTITEKDVILPSDPSSTSSGNNISAFGLTLGGNLNVSGNTTISGTLTTGTFSPATFAPATLSITGSETVGGPRPRVDVTAYGAKGDNSTDDTAAIQAAINAACTNTIGSGAAGGDLVFPPGVYMVTQTQLPSTAAIFSFPGKCDPAMVGLGGTAGGAQWPIMGHGAAIVVRPGTSPNAAPVFQYSTATANQTSISNLIIDGYNEAVAITNVEPVLFNDVCLTTSATGQTDNVPLRLSSTFWFWWKGGCIQSASPTLPIVLILGETVSGGDAASQLLYFSDLVTSGGPFQYIQRNPVVGGPAGDWVFRNITLESQNSDVLDVLESGSPGGFPVNGITFDHVNQADSMLTTAAVLDINAADALVSGVHINHSFAGNAGQGVAVRVTAGGIVDYDVSDCATYCTAAVVDGNNNAIGDGTQQTYNGGVDSVFDANSIVNGARPDRLQSQIKADSGAFNSPANRWFQSGTSIATLGVDPLAGFLFNDGTSYSFNASANETSMGTISLNYAQTLPPTGMGGAAAAGGSLPNGTYTAVVRATTDNCTHESAPSASSAGVVLSGSNGTINWSWTPASNYAGTVAGYCLTRGVGAGPFTNEYIFVSGANTTSYSDTGTAMTGGANSMVNTLVPVHSIAANAVNWGTNAVTFNKTSVPNAGVATPYAPACLAATTCSSFVALSPIVSDSFARANSSTLGANWNLNGGSFSISSNQAVMLTNSPVGAVGSWNGQGFGNSEFSRVRVGTAPTAATQAIGTVVYAAAAGTNTEYTYECLNDSGGAGIIRFISKVVGGAQTLVAQVSSNPPCVANDTLELVAITDSAGTVHLTAYYNASVDLTYVDASSPIAGGAPGILLFTSNTAVSIGGWSGGNLPSVNGTDSIYTRAGFYTQPQHATLLLADQGASQTNANIAISGWGTGAAVSASSGYSQRMRFMVTAGTSPSANPTITATFPIAFPSAPICMAQQTGGTGTLEPLTNASAETTATAAFQWNGTPASASTYIIAVDCR